MKRIYGFYLCYLLFYSVVKRGTFQEPVHKVVGVIASATLYVSQTIMLECCIDFYFLYLNSVKVMDTFQRIAH